LNSYVQSRLETFQTQEKNAEKRKKNCAKKARHHQQRMSIMGIPRGYPPPPPPPGGGGGGGGQRAFLHYTMSATTLSTLFAKKIIFFLNDFS
jgi:hypothetical protein